MSPFGKRRKKKLREFEILVIPQSDGGGTKSFKGSRLALWGSVVLAGFFLLFFLVFRFTPLGRLVGVKDVAVDSAEAETERRIRSLAEELAVLKEYNATLRKALGERTEKESAPPKVEKQNAEPVQRNQAEQQASGAVEDFRAMVATPQIVQSASTSAGIVEGMKASFPLFTPVVGVVTHGFEPNAKHYGVDYAAKEGTPVHAAAQGYVVFAGWTYDYGNTLIVSHGGGYITVYKHNSSLLKSDGSVVRRGELISLVGSTGQTSKGPHLHFEVLRDGVPLDPMSLLLNAKVAL